ncbi:hypothetical protein MRB53_004028 [Persea americana]|uniref:Uncharacterized protein n=1 Tax=Persea americana TaxID=3435 RepID=A0ACC2MZV3_PERAE|nr:hypothetical protein MRB53_004028 [Persea americana]
MKFVTLKSKIIQKRSSLLIFHASASTVAATAGFPKKERKKILLLCPRVGKRRSKAHTNSQMRVSKWTFLIQ